MEISSPLDDQPGTSEVLKRTKTLIKERFKDVINPGLKNCYVIDPLIIEDSLYNWQSNIKVSANRTFTQFAIIDDPLIHGRD